MHVRHRLSLLGALLLATVLSLPLQALPPAAPAAPTTPQALRAVPGWWKHAIFYEVYPRSFADSNNDGTGDLNGIVQHLDYLQSLGVDAIWITPFFPSPQVDFGYDISDYRTIDPRYGTMADFHRLVREAAKRHIRVLLDLVLNHTSDQDPWFIQSRSSRTSPYRNWYVWRDGKNGGPPNNWTSLFGGSAWQYDPKTKQYYYHYFYQQQPDLNWRNPAVQRAMFDVVRYWLKQGVAGFRLDAVTRMFEDPRLHDNPPGFIYTGDFLAPQQRAVYNNNLPEVHVVLRQLRALCDQYHAVLLGETTGDTAAELSTYYGKHNDETQLPFNFLFADVNKLSAPDFRKQIAAWTYNPAHGTPIWFFDNHDQPREINRYGDGKHNAEIARLLPTMLMTLKGSVVLYYGQAIGMVTTDPTSIDQVKDPIGRRFWPKDKGRDGERTPMQWGPGPNGGFTLGKPWLPVPPSAKTVNVQDENKNPDSLLNYYRALIHLKKTDPALLRGDWKSVNSQDPSVLSYTRDTKGETILVALNMTAQAHAEHYKLDKKSGTILIDSLDGHGKQVNLSTVELKPFEALVVKLQ